MPWTLWILKPPYIPTEFAYTQTHPNFASQHFGEYAYKWIDSFILLIVLPLKFQSDLQLI